MPVIKVSFDPAKISDVCDKAFASFVDQVKPVIEAIIQENNVPDYAVNVAQNPLIQLTMSTMSHVFENAAQDCQDIANNSGVTVCANIERKVH